MCENFKSVDLIWDRSAEVLNIFVPSRSVPNIFRPALSQKFPSRPFCRKHFPYPARSKFFHHPFPFKHFPYRRSFTVSSLFLPPVQSQNYFILTARSKVFRLLCKNFSLSKIILNFENLQLILINFWLILIDWFYLKNLDYFFFDYPALFWAWSRKRSIFSSFRLFSLVKFIFYSHFAVWKDAGFCSKLLN